MQKTDMQTHTQDYERIHAVITKLIAETEKINAESGKITKEVFWYPITIAVGFIGTVAGITLALVKLLS